MSVGDFLAILHSKKTARILRKLSETGALTTYSESKMKKILITTLAILTCASVTHAEEKYSHFPSLEATNIQTALCNIKSYNEKLAAITSKSELTTEDMVKVHEQTYTLENAVNFMKISLEQVSVDLEDVHKVSERLDQSTIKDSGEKYLLPTNLITAKKEC
jgi:hypothetical protein